MKGERSHSANSSRSTVSLILGLLGFHILVISYVLQSEPLLYLSLVDSAAALLVGIRTESNQGRAGVILGIASVLIYIVIDLLGKRPLEYKIPKPSCN